MGARYGVTRTSAALSTTNDAMTITAPAGRSLKIWAIRIYGAGTASGYNEVVVGRSTGGTTPGGTITPTPLNPDYAAATFTVATTWGAQPTLGAIIRRMGVNQNGAAIALVFPPGSEIDVPGGGQISIRSASGTNSVSIDVEVEQV